MHGATEVPLQTLRLACRALELGETVAQHGNVSAASDVGVAASLLHAACEGAAANVRINLGAWSEERFRTETAAEADTLASQAAASPRPHPRDPRGMTGRRPGRSYLRFRGAGPRGRVSSSRRTLTDASKSQVRE